MDNKQFYQITSAFIEVKEQIENLNKIKKQQEKARRKLKTLSNKYSFLKDIVGIQSKEERLKKSLKKYFQELGIERVELVPERIGIEDMRLWYKNKLILIEVTGRDKKSCDEHTTHDISKFIPDNREKYPDLDVSGLFIVNHDAKKNYTQRNMNPFNNQRMGNIAKDHHYTITTTTDLLLAFISIKLETLSIENFITGLCSFGEYKLRK